jgi:peptidyl-prolyl cis-trans isomerase SurA
MPSADRKWETLRQRPTEDQRLVIVKYPDRTVENSRSMRNASVVVGAVVVVASLLSSCRSAPGPSASAPSSVSADTWAVVDGRQITRDKVERELRRLRDNTQPISDEEALMAKLGILDDLILEEILLGRATTKKIEVPQTELDAAYAQAKKDLSDDAFQQELTRRNLTVADMREGLRRELLARKVIEQDVSAKIAVTDQEISNFFSANRAQFNLPEDAYRLGQIVVTPVREAQIANRTGDDATTPETAAAKVRMLMTRLKEGAPFAQLAMDYSEDPESAPRGGDLGLVPLSRIKQAPAPLRDAALTTTPGSAKVVSQGGNHAIVLVVSKEPAGQRELSTPGVRERITETLRGRREQLLRTAYLAAARTDADVVNYLARRVVEAQGKPLSP